MNASTYRHPGGWSVTIAEAVLSRWRTGLGRVESGGVLLGNRYEESADLYVDALTEPQDTDRRERERFYRDEQAHQRLVDRAWEESDGRRVYVGEWHSHTSGGPSPSPTDLLTWARFAREAAVLPLVFIVVTPGGIAAWGTAVPGELARLLPIQVSGSPSTP